jgi:hypothetical protein
VSDEQELNDLLSNEDSEAPSRKRGNRHVSPPGTWSGSKDDDDDDEPDKDVSHVQWAVAGNGRLLPVGKTVPKLRAGIYEAFVSGASIGMERMNVVSDGIYMLPDMATQTVLSEIQTFWESESKYRAHNLLYKRGVLLWGPPGGGKTVTVKILMNELVKRDGIVVIVNSVSLTLAAMKALRRIEPDRKLIVVLEDIDEIINNNGESGVLSMLDGEDNLDNVVNLATTNYPDRLGARIVNRPSRFDRRIKIPMPGIEARKAYLSQKSAGGLNETELARWVEDTDDMSIAHLRELVAAVYCLGQPYEEVIERLRKMCKRVKADPEFSSGLDAGFGSGKQAVGISKASNPFWNNHASAD